MASIYGRVKEKVLVQSKKFKRIPRHVAIIPDGNRRWAQDHSLSKKDGYQYGLDPALKLYQMCLELGVKELTFYGFTRDNTKRPADQRQAFQAACVDAVRRLQSHDADLLVVGDYTSPMFPQELLPFTRRRTIGKGLLKLNFLVNYDWYWDLFKAQSVAAEIEAVGGGSLAQRALSIGSADVSRIDLVVRWGGRRRLSGLLPVQSVYADFYVLDDYWPDFKPEHFLKALEWYQDQDTTLGG